MRKIFKAVVVSLCGLIVITGAVFAAYSADIVITENGTASYDMLAVTSLSNVKYMSENGYINAQGTDTRVLLSAVERPHMLASDRIAFALPVGVGSSQTLQFTTGAANLTAYDIVTGYGGSLAVSDNATLELGDNFTALYTGWLDTTDGDQKNIIYKEDAFGMTIGSTGNLTAGIPETPWRSPVGYADPGTEWTDETNAFDDNLATNAFRLNIPATTWSSYLELEAPAGLNSDRLRYYATYNAGIIDIIDVDVYYDGDWQDVYQGSFANQTWETRAYADGQQVATHARVRFFNSAAFQATAQLFEFDFYRSDDVHYTNASVTASGVASGIHTANVTAKELIWAPDNRMQFNGIANGNINAGALYSGNTTIWLSVWFRLDEIQDTSDPDTWIIGKYSSPTSDMRLMFRDNGRLSWEYYKGAGTYWWDCVTTKVSWDADTWYHVVAEASDNGTHVLATMTINGGAITATSDSDAGQTPFPAGFVIGNRYVSATTGVVGNISNVIAGSDNLTSAERSALYANTIPGDAEEIWYIDEGIGTSIISYGTVATTATAGAATSWEVDTRPCKMVLTLDDAIIDGFSRILNLPDNTNDWTMLGGNVSPYTEYLMLYHTEMTKPVADSIVRNMWYQPNDIVSSSTIPDRTGYSLAFANGASYSGDSVSFNITEVDLGDLNAYTIELWMRPYSNYQEVAFSEGNSTSVIQFIRIGYQGTNVFFSHRDDAAATTSLTYSTAYNALYYVVGVRSAANAWELYVNGVSRDTDATTVGTTTFNNAHLGYWERTTDIQGFDGYVDEVRIYTRALTPDEIWYNYNSGNGREAPYSSTDIIGEWHIEAGTGTSIVDTSGTGNDGTLTGGEWGTGLIDRDYGTNGYNPATISWGTTPSNVSVILGQLVSGYVPPGAVSTLTTPDVVPIITAPDTMFPTDASIRTAMESNPLYVWFDTWATASGIDILIMWWMFYLMGGIIVFTMSYLHFKNLLVSGALLLGVIGFGVSSGLWGFWLVILLLIVLLSFIAMERRPQL